LPRGSTRWKRAHAFSEDGAEARAQDRLGNEEGTNEIYTHVSIRQLKAIHESTHPGKMASAAAEKIRAEMADLEAENALEEET